MLVKRLTSVALSPRVYRRPSMPSLLTSPLPTSKREQHSSREQRSEHDLVIPSEPERKIDIEVVRAIVGEVGCHIGKWATEAISGQHEYFYQNDGDQHESSRKLTAPRDDRDGDDAAGKHGPGKRVNHFHHS